MKETKFIEQNREKWAEFEEILRYEGQTDPDKLNNLFIQITDDLSYARTFYPNRSVRMYLNGLGQKVFHNIYKGKRFPAERLKRFWTDELPQIMWESRRALWVSFGLFMLAFAVGVVSSMINPDFARIILGEDYVNMTIQNIENGDPMAVYKDSGPLGMTVGIAANNLFVALRTAIFGVIASIGTAFIMLYNGVMVGAFQYFFIQHGVGWESFLTIWIHGTLEIGAIIVAGAAGLVAGSGLLFPGTYRRTQAFQITMRRGLKIFIGVVPIIVLAAVFEGFLTRFTGTPPFIRGTFIFMSLVFMVGYFVWLPWHKARTHGFRQPIHDKELPPTREHVIDFKAIKTAGEITSDAFTILLRNPRTTLFGVVGTTGIFALLAFGLSTAPIGTTFNFPGGLFGCFDGATDFFRNSTELPFLFYLQIVLLAGLSLAAFRTIDQEINDANQVPQPRTRLLAVGLLLLIPASLLVLIFRFQFEDNTFAFIRFFSGWLLPVLTTPVLALWAAVLYFETANPFIALARTFRLLNFGQLFMTGFFTVSLGMLLTFFLSSHIWDIVLQFFSWLVPSGEGNMQTFTTFATTCAISVVLYFIFLLTILGGALQYFSNREVADAASLFEGIEKVGTTRRIRGLAREQ